MSRCLAGLIRRALIFCSDEVPLGKEIPDSAVEHACIEGHALIPGQQAKRPLLVDKNLVCQVVGFRDVPPIFLREEVVSSIGHLLKGRVSFWTGLHRVAVVRFRVANTLVAALVVAFCVFFIRAAEFYIESIGLHRAVNDVVSVILRLALVGVEEAGGPL